MTYINLYKELLKKLDDLKKNTKFLKFKDECSKSGTTEESIAQAEKIGFKTDLLAVNPLNEKIKVRTE